MTISDFLDLADGIKSVATVLALAIGGYWTYHRFISTGEGKPKVGFAVDVEFKIRQDDVWVVELVALIENKGLVRHKIKTFTFDLRHIDGTDAVEPKNGFDVFMPHKTTEGSWIPEGWSSTFVEAGIVNRYSVLARVPTSATAVLLHGKFYYDNGDWHTADKLMTVPGESEQQAQQTIGGDA